MPLNRIVRNRNKYNQLNSNGNEDPDTYFLTFIYCIHLE